MSTTFSRQEMQKIARERIEEISKEFSSGFRFLEDFPKSVTFFGSNQFKEDNEYYRSAETLASLIVKELGYTVITGGGPGIMEAANKGAQEAGGQSVGLTIELPHGQVVNKFLTNKLDFYYFFSRKVCLSFSAEAFIFFPGGYGTLDEFFEIITLVQTGKISGVPIILIGSDYWHSLESFLTAELLSRGTITPEDLELFTITDDHNEVLEIIKKTPVRETLPFSGGTTSQE